MGALLVGLAAFAGWTLARFSVPPRKGWFHRLGRVGILALSFSIVSPEVVIVGPGPEGVLGTSDDDTFPLQLIRPRTPSVTLSAAHESCAAPLANRLVDQHICSHGRSHPGSTNGSLFCRRSAS